MGCAERADVKNQLLGVCGCWSANIIKEKNEVGADFLFPKHCNLFVCCCSGRFFRGSAGVCRGTIFFLYCRLVFALCCLLWNHTVSVVVKVPEFWFGLAENVSSLREPACLSQVLQDKAQLCSGRRRWNYCISSCVSGPTDSLASLCRFALPHFLRNSRLHLSLVENTLTSDLWNFCKLFPMM